MSREGKCAATEQLDAVNSGIVLQCVGSRIAASWRRQQPFADPAFINASIQNKAAPKSIFRHVTVTQPFEYER